MSGSKKRYPSFPDKIIRVIEQDKASGRLRAGYLMDYYRDHPELLKKEYDLTVKEAEKIVEEALDKKAYG